MPVRQDYRFKLREDILGTPTPSPFESEDIKSPQGAFRPAPWLPIAFSKTDRDRGTEYFVISSGKPVCLTADGFLVPAGYRGKFNKTTATTVLTYTSTDYDEGVIDLVTGLAYAVDGTTAYSALEVAEALVERGLVPSDVAAANPPTSDAHVTSIVEWFFSLPCGVAVYDIWKWSGVAEENDQYWANQSYQHAVSFFTEHQMKVPLRAGLAVTDDDFDAATVDGSIVSAASGDGDFPQAGEAWDIDGIVTLTRYSSLDGDEPVVALALANNRVAKNTERTPVSEDLGTVLLKEKSSVSAISSAGDWYLDHEVGILFIHSTTWATLVADTATVTFSYTAYDDASTGAASEHYIYFDGEVRVGARVSIDEESNFVVKGSTGDILDSGDPDLGFVHGLILEPGPLMTMVKSRWELTGATKASKMPGTATKGYSHHVTIPDEAIADTLVKLTFRI